MATWEKILLGVAALLILVWFGPGVRATIERSRQAEQRDWKAFVVPLLLVVLFVVFLVSLVR